MLNSVVLHQAVGGGAGVSSQQKMRRRRSWVWNQFFILEEYTGDEPLYVGKVRERILSKFGMCYKRDHFCTSMKSSTN